MADTATSETTTAPPAAPGLVAAIGDIRRRMAPRCFVPAEDDTLRAAHVQYAEPAASLEAPRLAIVTVLKREHGRDVVATRLLPVKALEGGDHAAEDMSRITPKAILRHWSEAWTRGADLAPRLYAERRQAYWALARQRLRAAVPEAPPLDVLDAEALAAARAFCRHFAPPVRDALALMETLWRRPNIVQIQIIANDIAARRHPERFAQAFRAAPYLAWLMTRPGLGETPAWLAASVGDAIDAGTAPAEVVRAVCQPESKRQVRGFDVKAVMALADGFERGITLAHVLAILGDAFPETHRRAPPAPPDIAALVYAVCDICGSVS